MLWMIVVQVGNWGFPLCKETWSFRFDRILGFLVDMKLGVSSRLNCNGGTSSGRDLEITDFVDVFKDDDDLM
jgi:hypothetical protein